MAHITLRTPREIGLLLREARRRAKLDQATLAERIGVSRKWVIEAERGNPGAALGTILRALDAVGAHLSAAVHVEPSTQGTGKKTRSRPAAPAEVDVDAIIEAARKPRR